MKLSIITINYNNADHLAKTIKSVADQTWNEFEYIVIDGGSSDGSVEVIKQNSKHIDFWISEPDKGVFNAMNKGIEKSSGEYLLMLNAGDYLCDNKVLELVFASNTYKEDILAGDVYRAVNGEVFEKSYFPDSLTFNFFRHGSLSHQGTFIKRELHDTIGLYDETLKFSSDRKFFLLAICRNNVSYKHLPFFVAICDCSGLTCNPLNFPAMELEFKIVLKEYFPAFLSDYEDYDCIKGKIHERKLLLSNGDIKRKVKKWAMKYGILPDSVKR